MKLRENQISRILDTIQIKIFRPIAHTRGCIQKFQDWPPGAITANGTALCH